MRRLSPSDKNQVENRFFHRGSVAIPENNIRLFIAWIKRGTFTKTKIRVLCAWLLSLQKEGGFTAREMELFLLERYGEYRVHRAVREFECLIEELQKMNEASARSNRHRPIQIPISVLEFLIEKPSAGGLFILIVGCLQSTSYNDHVFCLNTCRLENWGIFSKQTYQKAIKAMKEAGVLEEIETPAFFVRENGKAYVWTSNKRKEVFEGEDGYLVVMRKRGDLKDEKTEDDEDGNVGSKSGGGVVEESIEEPGEDRGSQVKSDELCGTRIFETGGEPGGFDYSEYLVIENGDKTLGGDWLCDYGGV